MEAKDLTLNIAMNLSRMARWAFEGKYKRLSAFMAETESYVKQLERATKTPHFERTFKVFQEKFDSLKQSKEFSPAWVEEMMTWAAILTHRAKLA